MKNVCYNKYGDNMNKELCASIFVIDPETKRILLVKHREFKKWVQPGGHLEHNETPEEAAMREVFEETNIKVKILGEHFPREDDFIRPLGIQCNRKEGYVQVDILYFGIPSGNTEPYVDDEETIAAKWFTREELDAFSANSQQKCEKAMAEGKFKDEIVPVEVKQRKQTVIVDTDEGPRAGTTAESLSKLRCCSGKPDGVVTAGNASGINDGAAAVVVMSEEKAKELGVKPMATFVTGALGGVDPSIMGVGPVASTKKALAKANMTIDDMDLIEANEAFAAQSVAVARDLKFDMSKVNVNGGAIALGHPVGASGCRILVTLLHEMQKRDAKKGLATLCIGGGMGCTTIVERD